MKSVNDSILVSREAVSKLKPMNGSSKEPANKLSEGSILVIDDNFAIREALLTILCLLPGMTVRTAANGREGLQIVQQHHIDLVVLDLNMPEMSGEQTCLSLLQNAPKVKVIISSSLSQHEAQLRFGERELPSYLRKPYEIDALLSIVQTEMVITSVVMPPSLGYVSSEMERRKD